MLSIFDFFHDLSNPQLSFLIRALIVSLLGSFICSLIGCWIVLRGMSFMGDAVAHSVFPGIAASFLLGQNLLIGGALSGILTALLVGLLSQNRRLKIDAYIGVFFVSAFSLGILLISTSDRYTGSLEEFLFGSIAAVSIEDVYYALIIAVAISFLLLTFHRHLIGITLDSECSKACGISVLKTELVLYACCAIAVVVSVQTIGNVLVIGLLITPAAAARLLTKSLGRMMLLSVIIGCASVFFGIYLSWALNLPAGPAIVLVSTSIFIFAKIWESINRYAQTRVPSGLVTSAPVRHNTNSHG